MPTIEHVETLARQDAATQATKPLPRFVTVRECMAMLGCSRSTFYRLRRDNDDFPPAFSAGGRSLRFELDALLAWIDDKSTDAIPRDQREDAARHGA